MGAQNRQMRGVVDVSHTVPGQSSLLTQYTLHRFVVELRIRHTPSFTLGRPHRSLPAVSSVMQLVSS